MSETEPLCVTGLEELDEYMGPFPCRGLIVILGHPGAGKTTFSAQLIKANALRYGHKFVFVAFAETKETLLRNLRLVGIDLEELERKNLGTVLPLPTLAAPTIESLASTLNELIAKVNPQIVVLDGLTPLLQILGDARARSFLHGFLYQMSHIQKKLILAIADLPWGQETVHLGGIEFVADAVMLFKTRIEGGIIERWIEIRKFRGKEIPLVEIPFTITSGRGIIALIPTKLEEALAPLREEYIELHMCEDLYRFIGKVPRGTQVLFLYPPGSRIPYLFLPAIAINAVKQQRKVLILSYAEPEERLEGVLKECATACKVDWDSMQNYIKVKALNLTTAWIYGARATEFRSIEEFRPDIVIIVGLRLIEDVIGRDRFARLQFSDVLWYRKHRFTVFRFHAAQPDEYIPAMEYSDIVIRIKESHGDHDIRYRIEVLKSLKPITEVTTGTIVTLSERSLLKCLLDMCITE